MFVVGECDVWRDEDIVLNDYSCWDEDEGPNLAIVPNRNALFDIHVRIYLRILPDRATV